jgi:hypothetical protein
VPVYGQKVKLFSGFDPFGHMRARDFPSGGMAWIKQFKSSDKMKTEILLQY